MSLYGAGWRQTEPTGCGPACGEAERERGVTQLTNNHYNKNRICRGREKSGKSVSLRTSRKEKRGGLVGKRVLLLNRVEGTSGCLSGDNITIEEIVHTGIRIQEFTQSDLKNFTAAID